MVSTQINNFCHYYPANELQGTLVVGTVVEFEEGV